MKRFKSIIMHNSLRLIDTKLYYMSREAYYIRGGKALNPWEYFLHLKISFSIDTEVTENNFAYVQGSNFTIHRYHGDIP